MKYPSLQRNLDQYGQLQFKRNSSSYCDRFRKSWKRKILRTSYRGANTEDGRRRKTNKEVEELLKGLIAVIKAQT